MMNAKSPNRFFSMIDLAVIVLIIGVGVLSRFALEDFPNFKPIASLALFAGFYFRRWLVAGFAVVSMMLISDLLIGSYEWQIMTAVYASILFAGGLGVWVGRKTAQSGAWKGGLACIASAFAMALVFFLLTNLVTWVYWYEATFAGLVNCYVSALPFFRATLLSDLLFTSGWVVAYQAIVFWVARRDRAAVLERVNFKSGDISSFSPEIHNATTATCPCDTQ